VRIRNGRVEIVLHERTAGEGTPLLLLHALYGSSADWGAEVETWPGPVFALDFAGHGASGRVRGGAYDFERFLSDADLALRALVVDGGHRAVLAGAGLGAWYALVLAGARADRVPGCLLAPGAGLGGRGERPNPLDVQPVLPTPEQAAAFRGDADPYVSMADRELQPSWFSQPFAEAARGLVLLEDGEERPAWWRAAARVPDVRTVPDLRAGLAALVASSADQASHRTSA
jgi:pimeloyl-ACP methyl ester carboxylesterase